MKFLFLITLFYIISLFFLASSFKVNKPPDSQIYLYDNSKLFTIAIEKNKPEISFKNFTFIFDWVDSEGQKFPLIQNTNFTFTKTEEKNDFYLINFSLKPNNRWATVPSGAKNPYNLMLSHIYNISASDFSQDSNDADDLLEENNVVIAKVLPAFKILENTESIYRTKTKYLYISGEGFNLLKFSSLSFSPPLYKDIDYEDVTPYGKLKYKDEIKLKITDLGSWMEDDNVGPLKLVFFDFNGAGNYALNGKTGITVATVEEDPKELDIQVEDSYLTQLLYADDKDLFIFGSGFNEDGLNSISFDNNLSANTDYSIVHEEKDSETIHLKLKEGKFWRPNFANLPGVLTVMAIDAGAGFTNVGPLHKGSDVATIFAPPDVNPNPTDSSTKDKSSTVKIHNTLTNEFHIKGKGFPLKASGYYPKLKFNIDLTLDSYSIRVLNSEELEITLKDGMSWLPADSTETLPFNLKVMSINTKGDINGWRQVGGESGVLVATIISDNISDKGVTVTPSSTAYYESALKKPITVKGTNFVRDMKLFFNVDLKEGTDYSITFVNSSEITLNLLNNKKWKAVDYLLYVTHVQLPGDDKKIALTSDGVGIRIATILSDPSVTPNPTKKMYETQSKILVIDGSGFIPTNFRPYSQDEDIDVEVNLIPTEKSSYEILGVFNDKIRIRLLRNKSWLPSYISLNSEDNPNPNKSIDLKISSINTGAGLIDISPPIVIGSVFQDISNILCDDSCEFAFDDVCDDEVDPYDEQYYMAYGEVDDEIMKERAFGIGDDDYFDEINRTCPKGTDCTDCGGIEAILANHIDYLNPIDTDEDGNACTNTCQFSNDGICDDPRGTGSCKLGTDCADCGVVNSQTYTRSDDDGWWDDDDNAIFAGRGQDGDDFPFGPDDDMATDDYLLNGYIDDDYWQIGDADFFDQNKGIEHNREKIKQKNEKKYGNKNSNDEYGPAAVFIYMLETVVYIIGAIFLATGLYFLIKYYQGQSLPILNSFNSEYSELSTSSTRGGSLGDFEMRPNQRMSITPDEFRT